MRRGGTVYTNEDNDEPPSMLSMCLVLQALEKIVEVVKLVPQERVQQRSRSTTSLSSSTNDSTESAVAVHRQCRRQGSSVAVHRHGW